MSQQSQFPSGYEQQAPWAQQQPPAKKRVSGKVKMAIGVTASLLVGVAIGATGQSDPEVETVVDDEQIEELSAQVDELEAQVDELESERDGLNEEISALEAENETLRTQAADLQNEIDTSADVEEFAENNDDFNQLVFDLTWNEMTFEEKDTICWGVDFLGEQWTIDNWDEETSGISGEDMYPMFLEACDAEGLL